MLIITNRTIVSLILNLKKIPNKIIHDDQKLKAIKLNFQVKDIYWQLLKIRVFNNLVLLTNIVKGYVLDLKLMHVDNVKASIDFIDVIGDTVNKHYQLVGPSLLRVSLGNKDTSRQW